MSDLLIKEASDEEWNEFLVLARRSYGYAIEDADYLRNVADRRVAIQSGTVVGGGLGMVVGQFFGGQEVPCALLAAGCLAPELRGKRLAVHALGERLKSLYDAGAVAACAWTRSNEYGRALGWEAPCSVYSWTVRADDLRRAFPRYDHDVTFGRSSDGDKLISTVTRRWNGALARPDWWPDWKTGRFALNTYEFRDGAGEVRGVLTVSGVSRTGRTELHVHDFFAEDAHVASSMFEFLSRHNSRAEWVAFRRACLPPTPFLLHNLSRYRAEAEAHNPWMFRLLDVPAAIGRRGWPTFVKKDLVLEIEGLGNEPPTRYLVEFDHGEAMASVTRHPADFTLSWRQLSCWFAGGYRSAESAFLDGVSPDGARSREAMEQFVALTNTQEVWLPDQF
ncbi:sterol carrier protein domain-containing protein [Amycolatopsis coloradensis]|uniref:Sterol carrier protein domain-containing protein n=1 Tax=Amycolatopsis coloradensis TaxID=76021 RepID=A0ACD5BJK7_9PSEU